MQYTSPELYQFISDTRNDPIAERRRCRWTGQKFAVYQSEVDMLAKLSPKIAGKTYQLPLPQLCPEARQIHRQLFRNERKFYHNTCALSGKSVIATIHPDSPYAVVDVDEFFAADYTTYGIPYSGDFMTDLHRLRKKCPFIARYALNMDNASFCNLETDDTHCYRNVGGHENEYCMYNTYALKSQSVLDCYFVFETRHCYQSMHVYSSEQIFFSKYITGCFAIWGGYDLTGCQQVLFGYGLQNASYVFKNRVLPKEERESVFASYQEKIKTHAGLMEFLQEWDEFMLHYPRRATNIQQAEQIVGHDITNSKECTFVSVGEDGEHNRHCHVYAWVQDSMDAESIGYAERCYQTIAGYKVHACIGCAFNFDQSNHCFYGHFLSNSDRLLGSFGLSHKQYHILNMPYAKDEREGLASTIIEQMIASGQRGACFPTEMSPYPYNDTVAQEYYPVRELFFPNGDRKVLDPAGWGTVTVHKPDTFISPATLDLGGADQIPITWRMSEHEVNIPVGMKTVEARQVDEVSRLELKETAVVCAQSGRPFRYIDYELGFYERHGLPRPRLHPDVRHIMRMKQKVGRQLYLRRCDKTGEQIVSVYPQDAPFKVYAEKAYEQEVYG